VITLLGLLRTAKFMPFVVSGTLNRAIRIQQKQLQTKMCSSRQTSVKSFVVHSIGHNSLALGCTAIGIDHIVRCIFHIFQSHKMHFRSQSDFLHVLWCNFAIRFAMNSNKTREFFSKTHVQSNFHSENCMFLNHYPLVKMDYLCRPHLFAQKLYFFRNNQQTKFWKVDHQKTD
jgi:hypothetical protein